MEKETIEEKVVSNLNNALENGYDFTFSPSFWVADDILSYADYDFKWEFDNIGYDRLLEKVRLAVEEWQHTRKEGVRENGHQFEAESR